MKATELMIGDWVRFKGSDLCHKVEVVSDKRVNIGANWFSKSAIEPIPLTKEILEKNGFKRCNGNQWSLYKYEDDDYTKKSLYQVFWSANDLYLEIASYTSETGEFNRMGMQFVHQMQQAMRICGITKSIEI